MKVVALTDIHGDVSRLGSISNEISEADIVLITGDITHFGRADEARKIIETIRTWNDQILAIPGNCDYPEVGSYLTDEKINLDCRTVVFEKITFLGVGGSLPCPGKTPNEYSEREFKLFLQETAQDMEPGIPAALVVHHPPFDTATDLTSNGQHVGSRSFRTFIDEFQPLICFTGHIHESRGMGTVLGTSVVNPGPANSGNFTYARIGEKIEQLEIRSAAY